jgi:sugar O-acyltransferase (sialic acid O-acetyltransferase NeuD family)
MKKLPLIIFGLENFAEIAYEYFTMDSDFEVVAFTVDKNFIKDDTKFGLPIYPFEELDSFVEPSGHYFFAAITYTNMNDLRKSKLEEAKRLGFLPASYVSSRSYIWSNVLIGEHCFIFEDNTIQPFVIIGDNVVLWSGNHIGHHSLIQNHNFISSHVVVSGNCKIEDNCFLGVNATLSNNITIGSRVWVGPGALLTKSIPSGSLVTASTSVIKELDEDLLHKKLQSISKLSQDQEI